MPGLKQMVVISGKGGTGKTSVVASFAALAENCVLADTDVDAANLHIMLHPEIQHTEQFHGAKIAVRDETLCTKCGECERACRFDAITAESVSVFACEGCGLCTLVCPENALRLEPTLTGDLFISQTRYGPMAHAKLFPGGESSGRLVTMVRQAAENLALQSGRDLIIIDGPPGIGCTTTAAIAECNLALIVTEPTPSGIHDMVRVLGTTAHFGVPSAVIINKADLNAEKSAQTAHIARENGAQVIGELPFDPTVTKSVAATTPLVEFAPDAVISSEIAHCWGKLKAILSN